MSRWHPIEGCTIEGCARPHAARGYCDLHYRRLRRYGDPLSSGSRIVGDHIARFWVKVAPPDESECWRWLGSPTANGYGQMSLGSDKIYAHRFSYETLVGPIPPGLQLDHLCRVRICVSPAHLKPVTSRENVTRGYRARRMEAGR